MALAISVANGLKLNEHHSMAQTSWSLPKIKVPSFIEDAVNKVVDVVEDNEQLSSAVDSVSSLAKDHDLSAAVDVVQAVAGDKLDSIKHSAEETVIVELMGKAGFAEDSQATQLLLSPSMTSVAE